MSNTEIIEPTFDKIKRLTAENERLLAAVEDAIDALEAMDLHIDNPLYERLCAACQQETTKP